MKTVVAIDGPAASGKSTTARQVAQALGYVHLDTGAMYRAVTLACQAHGIKPEPSPSLDQLLTQLDIRFTLAADGSQHVWLADRDITADIRTPGISDLVSAYSALPTIRDRLVILQRRIGETQNIVCEGRDIGTRVFPEAQYKFFLIAELSTRAERRLMDLRAQGINTDLGQVQTDLMERDQKDMTRAYSPLVRAEDAIEIDTTNLTIEGQVAEILKYLRMGAQEE